MVKDMISLQATKDENKPGLLRALAMTGEEGFFIAMTSEEGFFIAVTGDGSYY